MTYTTHEQATRLKALGYDKPTRDYYENDGYLNRKSWPIMKKLAPSCCLAPTPSEVLDWFREEKGIDAWVESIYDFDNKKKYIFVIHKHEHSRIRYFTHSEATSALIDKLIEILEEQKASAE